MSVLLRCRRQDPDLLMPEVGFMRIGIGFDAHAFAAGRPLVIGGVTIPHPRGLAGHSDADVLYHAIGDAILGALGLGDLGEHFPDGDPAWRGADSRRLIEEIVRLMTREGYTVVNVDSVVIAQEPRLSPYRDRMKANIAAIMGLAPDAVGVKATTTEQMGFTGRGEGIAAQAVVLIEKKG
jgi:2-C-methyl-D-erythritol 2,4-cyclodiphosphate synthase